MVRRFCSPCARSAPASDPRGSAAWMLGISLATVVVAFTLDALFGQSVISRSLLSAGFPVALLVATFRSTPGRYTPAVRRVLLATTIVLVYAFFVAVTLLADRI